MDDGDYNIKERALKAWQKALEEIEEKDKEIERLKKLVKSAYEEGWNDGISDEGGYNEGILENWWEMSETLEVLKKGTK